MIRTRKPFALLHTGLILLLFALYACGKTYQDDTAFNDKITLLENHPEAILAQPDSTDFSRITTEKEATAFLLRSLARHYTSRDFYPEKEKLQECIRIFRSRNKVQQELEALFLLAETCKKENNTAEEIAAIEQGMKLAELADDPVWKFHLYNYLSDMYLRKYDMLKFIKNQALANQSIKEINTNELDPFTLTLLGKSYLYTDQLAKAETLLTRLKTSVSQQHICYTDICRLLGITYFKQKRWENAATELKTALASEKDSSHCFTCSSMLAFCQDQLGNEEETQYYKEQALRFDTARRGGYKALEFYKLCIDLARRNGNREEETFFTQKMTDQYERMVKELNEQTLDEAIEGYMRIQDQNEYNAHIRTYQLILGGMLLLLACMVIYYLNRRRKQMMKYFNLQHRIEALEKLENIQDETKALILQELEIAKQIAMLKHTQKEKSEKLLKELDKLNLLKGNKLLSTRWNDFYHHIDISFNHFHERLTRRYPALNEKEVQLCCLMKAGFRTEEIAAVWMQSVFTVHKYKTSIRKKTEAPEAADILVFLDKTLAEN